MDTERVSPHVSHRETSRLTLADLRILVDDRYAIDGTELAPLLMPAGPTEHVTALRGLVDLLRSHDDDDGLSGDGVAFVIRSLSAIVDQLDAGLSRPDQLEAEAQRCRIVIAKREAVA